MFLVDTDVLSLLRKRNCAPELKEWFASQHTSALFISVITVGEIERGVERKRREDVAAAEALASWLGRILTLYGDRILPFDLGASRRWGRLSAALGNESADLQIAATALEHGLSVVTRNVRHFGPTGVPILNPLDLPVKR